VPSRALMFPSRVTHRSLSPWSHCADARDGPRAPLTKPPPPGKPVGTAPSACSSSSASPGVDVIADKAVVFVPLSSRFQVLRALSMAAVQHVISAFVAAPVTLLSHKPAQTIVALPVEPAMAIRFDILMVTAIEAARNPTRAADVAAIVTTAAASSSTTTTAAAAAACTAAGATGAALFEFSAGRTVAVSWIRSLSGAVGRFRFLPLLACGRDPVFRPRRAIGRRKHA
jgi:hypothetical protein